MKGPLRRYTGQARSTLVKLIPVLAAPLIPGPALCAQEPVLVDTAFHPEVLHPAYPSGQGPRVLIDEAHHNLKSLLGFHASFGELLRADGYQVASLREPITVATL